MPETPADQQPTRRLQATDAKPVMPARPTPGMQLIRRSPLPLPTKPSLGFPSSQMLMFGFLFGCMVALFLGAPDLAAPLGLGTAILFGAVDI
jgi:hypothetical protein